MNKKCRLIWDDSTPCADRRPTTPEDLEDDIHVVDYESETDLLNELFELAGYDPEDIDIDETLTQEQVIKKVIRLFDDVGDGSPNILYVSIGGKDISGSLPYDSLSNIDLEKATREEVIETLKSEFDDEDDDSDEDDEDNDDEDADTDDHLCQDCGTELAKDGRCYNKDCDAYDPFSQYFDDPERIDEDDDDSDEDDDEDSDEITYTYVVYELDEEGDEVDSLESFNTLEEAITFAEKQSCRTHIVYVPDQDPDDYGYPDTPDDYEAYEVVWSSDDEDAEDDVEEDDEDDVEEDDVEEDDEDIDSPLSVKGFVKLYNKIHRNNPADLEKVAKILSKYNWDYSRFTTEEQMEITRLLRAIGK